ncbi:unnamed protein product [Phytomonas sp. Hart1]|nr:unnamed protein product [Phytomonas sp. Hart1]|eukprot:CCW72020.1 unnamed protein product [Phytomonas sp. isolate Hart1]
MDDLQRILHQARGLVVSAGRDLDALQAQLGGQEGAIPLHPGVVNLQATVQQRHEAAAQLFLSGFDLFSQKLGELDCKASTLGNVFAKDKELNTIQKTMRRYFDGQQRLRVAEEADLHRLLTMAAIKQHHLADAAADLSAAHFAERVRRRVLSVWLKKWMRRSQVRAEHTHQDALRRSHGDLARRFLLEAQEAHLKRTAWQRWSKSLHKRNETVLLDEIHSLKRTAEGLVHDFQGKAHAQMRCSAHAQSQLRALFEDEIGRLKQTLEAMTGEFSARTCTYVRQQEETEQFFRLREDSLRGALNAASSDAESSARRVAQSFQSMQNVGALLTVALGAFFDYAAQKADLFLSVFLRMQGDLLAQYATSRQEASRLLDDVRLLAPLSEQVVCLQGDLSRSLALLKTSQSETRRLRGELATAHAKALALDEAEGRLSIEKQESLSRGRLWQKNARTWGREMDWQSRQLLQITAAYEEWQRRYVAETAARVGQDRAHYVMLSQLLQNRGVQRLASQALGLWRGYAFRRSSEHGEGVHRLARQDDLDASSHLMISQLQQLQDESRAEMMQLHTEHLQTLERGRFMQEKMVFLNNMHNKELALVNAEHLKIKQTHTILKKEHETCKKRLGRASGLLVKYCAADKFARWKAWACGSLNQRLQRQYQELLWAASHWQDSLLHNAQFFYQKREALLFDSMANLLVVSSSQGRKLYSELSVRVDSLNLCNEETEARLQNLESQRHQLEIQLTSEEAHSGKLKNELIEINKTYEDYVSVQSSWDSFFSHGHRLVEIHLEEVITTFLTASGTHWGALRPKAGMVSSTMLSNAPIEADEKTIDTSAPQRSSCIEKVQEFSEAEGGMGVHTIDSTPGNFGNVLQATQIGAVDGNQRGVPPLIILSNDVRKTTNSFVKSPDKVQKWAFAPAELMEPPCTVRVQDIPESNKDTEEIYVVPSQNVVNSMERQTAISLGDTPIGNNQKELMPHLPSPIHAERFDMRECYECSKDIDEKCEAGFQTQCESLSMGEDSFQEPIAVLQDAVNTLMSLLSRVEGLDDVNSSLPLSRPTDPCVAVKQTDNPQQCLYADTQAPLPKENVSQKGSPDIKDSYFCGNKVSTEKVASMDRIHQTKGLVGQAKSKLSDVMEFDTNKTLYEAQAETQCNERMVLEASVSGPNANQGRLQERMGDLLLCEQDVGNTPIRLHFRTETAAFQKGIPMNKGTSHIESTVLKRQLDTMLTQIIEVGALVRRIFHTTIDKLRDKTEFMHGEIQRIQHAGAEETQNALTTLKASLEMRFQIQLISLQERIQQLELEKGYFESRDIQIMEGSTDLLSEVQRGMVRLASQYQISIEALKMYHHSHRDDLKGEVYLFRKLTAYGLQVCSHCFILSHGYAEACSEKVDGLTESFLSVCEEGSQSRGSPLRMLRSTDSNTPIRLLLDMIPKHWAACAELHEECLKKKYRVFTDGITFLMQGCWEKCDLFIEQTKAIALSDMEALETENIQLHEKLACLEAQTQCLSQVCTGEDGHTRSEEAYAQTGVEKCDAEQRSSDVGSQGAVLPPSQETAIGKTTSDYSTGNEENPSPSHPIPHNTISEKEENLPTSSRSNSGDAEVTPNQGSMTNSYCHSPFTYSPSHVKDISLESLELSLGISRYSNMLSEQTSRNEERLGYVDSLSAELEDLTTQGHRVWNLAKREHLTPKRRKHGGRKPHS